MLKVMVLDINDPMALERIRPARGFCIMSFRGMMGRGAWYSTQMNRGKLMVKIIREETTKG